MTAHKDVGDGDKIRLVSTFGSLRGDTDLSGDYDTTNRDKSWADEARHARDKAIIEATLCHFDPNPLRASRGDIDAIIATVDQEIYQGGEL